MLHRTGPQDVGQGQRTYVWARAEPIPEKRAGQGYSPHAFGVRAQWPVTEVLCPMAWSYVLWPCPMSCGPSYLVQTYTSMRLCIRDAWLKW